MVRFYDPFNIGEAKRRAREDFNKKQREGKTSKLEDMIVSGGDKIRTFGYGALDSIDSTLAGIPKDIITSFDKEERRKLEEERDQYKKDNPASYYNGFLGTEAAQIYGSGGLVGAAKYGPKVAKYGPTALKTIGLGSGLSISSGIAHRKGENSKDDSVDVYSPSAIATDGAIGGAIGGGLGLGTKVINKGYNRWFNKPEYKPYLPDTDINTKLDKEVLDNASKINSYKDKPEEVIKEIIKKDKEEAKLKTVSLDDKIRNITPENIKYTKEEQAILNKQFNDDVKMHMSRGKTREKAEEIARVNFNKDIYDQALNRTIRDLELEDLAFKSSDKYNNIKKFADGEDINYYDWLNSKELPEAVKKRYMEGIDAYTDPKEYSDIVKRNIELNPSEYISNDRYKPVNKDEALGVKIDTEAKKKDINNIQEVINNRSPDQLREYIDRYRPKGFSDSEWNIVKNNLLKGIGDKTIAGSFISSSPAILGTAIGGTIGGPLVGAPIGGGIGAYLGRNIGKSFTKDNSTIIKNAKDIIVDSWKNKGSNLNKSVIISKNNPLNQTSVKSPEEVIQENSKPSGNKPSVTVETKEKKELPEEDNTITKGRYRSPEEVITNTTKSDFTWLAKIIAGIHGLATGTNYDYNMFNRYQSLRDKGYSINDSLSVVNNKDLFNKYMTISDKGKSVDKNIDLGDRVRVFYSDGTFEDIKKGKSSSDNTAMKKDLSGIKKEKYELTANELTVTSYMKELNELKGYYAGTEGRIKYYSDKVAVANGTASEEVRERYGLAKALEERHNAVTGSQKKILGIAGTTNRDDMERMERSIPNIFSTPETIASHKKSLKHYTDEARKNIDNKEKEIRGLYDE